MHYNAQSEEDLKRIYDKVMNWIFVTSNFFRVNIVGNWYIFMWLLFIKFVWLKNISELIILSHRDFVKLHLSIIDVQL